MFLFDTSRLRRRLLTYTLFHAEETWYVRQLAQLIQEDPGNLSRELAQLEKEGLFRVTPQANLRLYSLNRDYPLLGELRSIIFKTEMVRDALRDTLAPIKSIRLAFACGPFVTTGDRRLTGIDLVLMGTRQESAEKRIRGLAAKLGRDILCRWYEEQRFLDETAEPGSFLDQSTREGILILKGELPEGVAAAPQLELEFSSLSEKEDHRH